MTRWKTLKIKMRRRYIDPLCGFLYPRGCLGLSYDEITIKETSKLPHSSNHDFTIVTAYFSMKSDTRNIAKGLREFVAGLNERGEDFAVESAWVEDFGWAHKWKEFFRPMKIGKSVIVTPSWEKFQPVKDETLIVIDPGEAFGTGSHETTRLCIELIEEEFERSLPQNCIDIGCGTGILGILMAKKGAKSVHGIDIDKTAVEIANRNSRVNLTENIFRATNRPLGIIREKFDFFTANIIAETLVSIIDDIVSILDSGGRGILSGILVEKTDWVEEEFQRAGFLISKKPSLGLWSAIGLKKV